MAQTRSHRPPSLLPSSLRLRAPLLSNPLAPPSRLVLSHFALTPYTVAADYSIQSNRSMIAIDVDVDVACNWSMRAAQGTS